MPRSYNGWYASPDLKTRVIEPVRGCRLRVLDNNDVAEVFSYLVLQFHLRVDDVTKPHPADDWGYYYRPNRNDPSQLSCHASATAIDLDATEHPNGVSTSRTFTPRQIAEVHEILRELDGVIRWGGDYTRTADAMHFEIIKNAAAVKRVANKIRKKKTRSELSVISYNVQIGPWDDDLKEIRRILQAEDPDVVFLYEASNLFGHLDVKGYEVAQMKPKRMRKGSISNNGNIAVLVKANLRRSWVQTLRMKRFWKGPKHGHTQDPRTYRWLGIRKNGVLWKVGGFHLPFGKSARLESISAMKRWFRDKRKGRPMIAVTDYNANKASMEDRVADPVGANVVGRGVDLAAYKNCSLVRQEVLQARANDHPVMKWTFRK